MKALDLFCGGGGVSMGLQRAGFDVVGVDLAPQPNYPFEFHQADAMTYPLDGFDVVFASPPCQGYSITKVMARNKAGGLVPDVRNRLKHVKYYCIENVPGAPLNTNVLLCGTMFGLKVFRHRLFETNFPVWPLPHYRHTGTTKSGEYFTVCGGKCGGTMFGGVRRGTKKQWAEAMGIDWMTKIELAQAIQPAYTEYIGRQLIDHIEGLKQAV